MIARLARHVALRACALAVGLAGGAAWAASPALSLKPLPDATAFEAVAQTVRSRQYNPLRAARVWTALSVAQAEASSRVMQRAASWHLVATHQDAQASAQLASAWLLWWMFPQESLEPWFVSLLPVISSATNDANGPAFQAVSLVIERTLTDGADARRRPLLKPHWQPGLWQRTPPLLAEQPTEPQAPQWRPWCPGTEGLLAPPPPPHGGEVWQRHMAEVAAVAKALTPQQRDAAFRWNLDAGSVTPPGLWNILVREHLQQYQVEVTRYYRILALMNMAMHDALVAGWRTKLTHWTERPHTAVRREIDQDFVPLLPTPPFPGYVSGHAVVSGAAAAVLSQLLPDAAAKWQALANEAAMSRLWGGIHPRYDNDEGLALGRRVATLCLKQFEPDKALVTEGEGSWPYLKALPRIDVLLE